MEKKLKKMLLGMLVMSMLLGGVVSAQANTVDCAIENEKAKVVVSHGFSVSPPISEIQYQKFIAYLTQEYAPELKAEWEKAFAVRSNIEFPIQNAAPTMITVHTSNTDEAKNSDAKKFIIKEGEINSMSLSQNEVIRVNMNETMVTGLLTITLPENEDKNLVSAEERGIISVSLPQEDNITFVEQQKLKVELDNAITSNDGQAINAVLGKMLKNYNAVSEDIKSSLSKVEINDNKE